MNVIVIIMHLVNGSVAEATLSVTAPKILCDDAIKQIAILSTEESAIRYKGNRVFLYYCKGILEGILAAHNGHKVRVPNNIFGCFMQFVKIWRTISNPIYKKDTYDDVNGYNELNRRLKIKETENAK